MGLFVCIGEDLLYFRGGCGGRVKVACRLLYSIFRVGRGLLYFIDSSYGTIYNNYFLRAR
jgi:hypothetical protein